MFCFIIFTLEIDIYKMSQYDFIIVFNFQVYQFIGITQINLCFNLSYFADLIICEYLIIIIFLYFYKNNSDHIYF